MASPVRSIDWGTRQATSLIDVYLVPNGQAASYSTQGNSYQFWSAGWNAYETQQVDLALTQIENVANVQFSYVGGQASAELALTTAYDPDPYVGGFMGPPGVWFAGLGGFNKNALGWDESAPGTGGLEQGGEGFKILLHELGHGMGLAHTHDSGGKSARMAGVSSPFFDYGKAGLNQGIFTVMSYNSSWQTNPDGLPTVAGASYGHEGTMMALDIAVLQRKYGANLSHANGDDVYTLPSTNGSGTFYSCIWDAGGIDEIRADAGSASTIDLRAATLKYGPGGGGFVSYSTDVKGGFTIAKGVVIENATGSHFDDKLIGNGAANVLQGLGGADVLAGLGGQDTLIGGNGADTLRGGDGHDDLFLGPGVDSAFGGRGRDDIYAGLLDLAESVNGGKGVDCFHFDLDDAGHTLAVRNGKVIVDGNRFGVSLERVDVQSGDGDDVLRGGRLSDTLSGGGGDDVILGGRGNDILVGGLGNDILRGQAGADVFDFVTLSGADTVADFRGPDTAVFSTSDLSDFTDFVGSCAEVGGDTVLTLASGTVLFAGLSLSDFGSDQFDFV